MTQATRKTKIRKAKTDKTDAFLICEILMTHNYTPCSLKRLELQEIKELARYHASLKEDINQLKNQLQKEIDLVFPEYNSLFKSKYSRTYLQLLKSFPSAQLIACAPEEKLRDILSPKGRGRTCSLKMELLIQTASQSIGNDSMTARLMINHLILRIEVLEDACSEVDKNRRLRSQLEVSYLLNSRYWFLLRFLYPS